MLYDIYLGFILGLSVCLPVGPINILILNLSAKELSAALAIGFGAACCDTFYLIVFGLAAASLSGVFADVLGFCGALILFYMAAQMIVQPASDPAAAPVRASASQLAKNFAKGFAINALNPYVVTFWLGIGGQIATAGHPLAFGAALSAACYLWVIALSLVVSKYARFLRPRLLRAINVISGLILCGFALRLLAQISFIAEWLK